MILIIEIIFTWKMYKREKEDERLFFIVEYHNLYIILYNLDPLWA